MGFRNSILAGEELVRTAIRSPNYDPGVAGWRIARNGDAEFNDVTVRGTLSTGTGRPRIEIIPDDGTGQPVIELWPEASLAIDAPAKILVDLVSGILLLVGPDQTGGGEPGEVLLLENQASLLGAILDLGHPDSVTTPVATVNGALFQLYQQTVTVKGSPAGNDDANSAVFTQWGPSTNIAVPPWATAAHISVAIIGVHAQGAVGTACGLLLRCVLDGQPGEQVSVSGVDVANSPRVSYAWNDVITGFTTGGSKSLRIQETRTSGAAVVRADTASDFTYQVHFVA